MAVTGLISEWEVSRYVERFFSERFQNAKFLEVVGPDGGLDEIVQLGAIRFGLYFHQRRGVHELTFVIGKLRLACIRRKLVPLLVVPYMTEAGKGVAAEEKIDWIDLSGNASIKQPGLIVEIEGKPNAHSAPGRPVDIYAPQASRVIRAMLENPKIKRQSEIVFETRLHRGSVSRLVSRLAELHVVEKDGDLLRLVDREKLLTSWSLSYQFEKHSILKGHIPGNVGERMVKLQKSLTAAKIDYAFTGLAAANEYTNLLTGFRLLTIYVGKPLQHKHLNEILFVEDPEAANIWLVSPNDKMVTHGSREINGFEVVSPLQAYLDLSAQPERASEMKEPLMGVIRKRLWHQ